LGVRRKESILAQRKFVPLRYMEPIVTIEGYKILQDSEAASRIVREYYEKLGYTVIDPSTPSTPSEKQVKEDKR
jgi:hypothetical protein